MCTFTDTLLHSCCFFLKPSEVLSVPLNKYNEIQKNALESPYLFFRRAKLTSFYLLAGKYKQFLMSRRL